MENAFTGIGHDNDRQRMKDILEKLTAPARSRSCARTPTTTGTS